MQSYLNFSDIDLQSGRYLDCAMGHCDQVAKASWQWNLDFKVLQTRGERCTCCKLESNWVDIISGRYHHGPFLSASGTEIDVTHISMLG